MDSEECYRLIRIFDGLPRECVRPVLCDAQTRQAPAGEVLCRENAPARKVHILISGFAKGIRTRSGTRLIIRYLTSGETLDPSAFIKGSAYPADVVAVTSCTELQWPAQIFRDLAARHPQVAFNMIRELEGSRRELENRLGVLSSEPVEQRIAHGLLRLIEKVGVRVGDGIEVPFPLSRQDLAEMTGTTLYTVSRTLGYWEAHGEIRRGRQRVVVSNLEFLKAMSGGAEALEAQPRRTHRRAGPTT